jgi:hypothetical protein
MVDCAVPSPAAQICPSRPEPVGKVAEQDCQPGMAWMELIVVCDCVVTVMLRMVAEMYPWLSSAMTSSVCCPGATKICVLMELVKAK